MAANKPMFAVGILIIATATMFFVLKEDLGITPIILGIIGIVLIGASKYRLLSTH